MGAKPPPGGAERKANSDKPVSKTRKRTGDTVNRSKSERVEIGGIVIPGT
jgi:hypothetical protein